MSSLVFRLLAALVGGWTKVAAAKPKPKPPTKKTAATMQQEAMNSHRCKPLLMMDVANGDERDHRDARACLIVVVAVILALSSLAIWFHDYHVMSP
jgi:hypothetical protein